MTLPLNKRVKNVNVLNGGYGIYQYFLKVVSTEFKYHTGKVLDTNQFSVTEHFRPVSPRSGKGFPGNII